MSYLFFINMRRWGVALGLFLASAAVSQAADDPGAELGRALYTNCAACHGASGEGGFGPPLAHDTNLNDDRYVIAHVTAGSANMPPFKDQLSPQEIAAVINYIRNSWGNGAAKISGADINEGK